MGGAAVSVCFASGMRKSLPPSPTPANVADAYAARVADEATTLAGRDGRISANEASKSAEVKDAHHRTGRSRPVVRTVVEAARVAMLAEAGRVTGGDGRVSLADARKMPSPFVEAFEALRGIPRDDDARAVVAELRRLVEGLMLSTEADYVYEPFSKHLDAGSATTIELLEQLPWNEGPADQPEWTPPAELRLEVSSDDSFWLDEAEKDPYRAEAYRALDRFMKRVFAEETVRRDGESLTARIFSVTLPEGDAALAPYFVLGRLASGELVGLRTFRVWT
jgi:hypothetical protein